MIGGLARGGQDKLSIAGQSFGPVCLFALVNFRLTLFRLVQRCDDNAAAAADDDNNRG